MMPHQRLYGRHPPRVEETMARAARAPRNSVKSSSGRLRSPLPHEFSRLEKGELDQRIAYVHNEVHSSRRGFVGVFDVFDISNGHRQPIIVLLEHETVGMLRNPAAAAA